MASERRFALIATAVSFVIGWHPLRESAAPRGNATAQPLDYATAMAVVVAIIWVLAGVWAAIAAARRARVQRRTNPWVAQSESVGS